MQTEDELSEIALLRYAQQRAAEWGAERFAAEFARRELEERWLEASRLGTTPHSPVSDDPSASRTPSGPVDATAQEHVVGVDRSEFHLARPAYARHPSVPRPPAPEPEERGRRGRRRRQRAPNGPASSIPAGEAARMSAAGRRLYGLDDDTTA
ncbi:MAG TPA: hypothetical protein VFZ75_01020 [Actinomycetota bacterium]|nr:hypothetical protein [Actinomycetota bacterium]